MKTVHKIFQYNILGFKLYLLLSLILAVFYFIFKDIPVWTIYSTLLMYFIYGCLGIVVTFHRNLTHHSYKVSKVIENIFTLLGTLAGTGSSIAWVNMHVLHHKYSDTVKDAHSPKNGLLNTLLLNYNVENELTKPAKVLIHDRYHLFLHKYYNLIHILFAVVLFSLFGTNILFGFYILPMLLTAVMSNLVNYLGHSQGYRNFDTKDYSTNSFIAAALSFGEGWHNNHHKYPSSPNFGGHRWWEFDLSYYIIKMIRK